MSVKWTKHSESEFPYLLREGSLPYDIYPQEPLKHIVASITTAAAPCVWGILGTVLPTASAVLSFNRSPIEQITDDNKFDDLLFQEEMLHVSLSDSEEAETLFNKWVTEIEELGTLERDWDGENAPPVYKDAISNCRGLLSQAMSSIFNLMEVYPTTFGTICLEWRNNANYRLNLEMGKTLMGFYLDSPKEEEIYAMESSPINKKNTDILLQNLYRLCQVSHATRKSRI